MCLIGPEKSKGEEPSETNTVRTEDQVGAPLKYTTWKMKSGRYIDNNNMASRKIIFKKKLPCSIMK